MRVLKVVEELQLPLEGVMARAGTVYVTFKADLRNMWRIDLQFYSGLSILSQFW